MTVPALPCKPDAPSASRTTRNPAAARGEMPAAAVHGVGGVSKKRAKSEKRERFFISISSVHTRPPRPSASTEKLRHKSVFDKFDSWRRSPRNTNLRSLAGQTGKHDRHACMDTMDLLPQPSRRSYCHGAFAAYRPRGGVRFR